MDGAWTEPEAVGREPQIETVQGALSGLQVEVDPLPSCVAAIRPEHIEARIEAWRAGHSGFDTILREGASPALALRRLALTHWSLGNPRLASTILATAAALGRHSPEIWLDLGFTLQAIGDRPDARGCFLRALRLDPAPANAWLALAIVGNELGLKPEAEAAFVAALDRNAALAEAHFGLALILFEQRRYAEAAPRFAAALTHGCQNPLASAGLGQSLFFVGDFRAAAEALGRSLSPTADGKIVQRAALARYLDLVIREGLAPAEQAYADIAGAHAEPPRQVAQTAFHILSGYGHRAAALDVAQNRLADAATDPIHRYLVDAVAGEPRERAPSDYLIAYFDRFADDFDRQLIDVLGYRAPQDLAAMLTELGRPGARALDLGCGTGLAGALLKPGRKRLVGVDLAPRMLEKARDRGVYDELVEAEMVEFLTSTRARFDLVFVADALVYLGALEPFFRGASRVLAPHGLLALTIETTQGAPYRLLPSGRFAHDLEALAITAAPWFDLRAHRPTLLRSEANKKIVGSLVILERRRSRSRR